MQKKPFLTVLIPSWNSESFIARGVRSILKNSYRGIEVLIVDNNSTDATRDIVASLKDDRVIFSPKKDKGMYEALNRGIKEANGEIICWIGADDRYEKGALKIIAGSFMLNQNVNWIVGEGKFIFENENNRTVYHQLPQKVSADTIIKGNPLISPSVAFRKSFFEKAGCFNESYKYASDYDLWIKFSLMQDPLVIHTALSLFSFNGSNISSKNKIKIYRETIRILSNVKNKKYLKIRLLNQARMIVYICYNFMYSLIK